MLLFLCKSGRGPDKTKGVKKMTDKYFVFKKTEKAYSVIGWAKSPEAADRKIAAKRKKIPQRYAKAEFKVAMAKTWDEAIKMQYTI
jgi:hypothetical protein